LYREVQNFRQKWLWTLLILTGLVSIYFPFKTQMIVEAVILAVIYSVFLAAFYSIRLETHIDENGIFYRFWPFHLKERKIDYEDIKEFQAGHYSPLREFGGWGLRWRPGKVAFSVSGNECACIEREKGRKIILGTQKPEELMEEVEKHL